MVKFHSRQKRVNRSTKRKTILAKLFEKRLMRLSTTLSAQSGSVTT